MTFDMETARAWSYETAAASAREVAEQLRPLAEDVSGLAEPLLPERTYQFYGSPVAAPTAYLPIRMVDRYRCWPKAPVREDLKESLTREGMTTPIVIYTDGISGVLGDGQHRLAAAWALGWDEVPVWVVPDRLELPTGIGMNSTHLTLADDDLRHYLDLVVRVHMRSLHRISTHTADGVVNVFCLCGAQWKRPA
jgi:hypothetical protein